VGFCERGEREREREREREKEKEKEKGTVPIFRPSSKKRGCTSANRPEQRQRRAGLLSLLSGDEGS
jgi:hypothetical protein